jgi:hypothetical protein
MNAVPALKGRRTEPMELLNPYNNLERNFPAEPQRNRTEPISNDPSSEVPFSSTVVPSLVPVQVIDIRE